MQSCEGCRWWTQGWKGLRDAEGACMVSRTELDSTGVCHPIVPDARMRAVANDGHVAATLVTHADFVCAQFAPR
jgi:hypothetical protein